jgi:protease-4
MNFLKSCLAAFLALVVFTALCIFLVIGLLAGLSSKEEVKVADNSVLHLKLDAEISEMQQDNPLAGLPLSNSTPNVGLLQLKQAIEEAKTDSNIKGIYLDVSYPMTGYSSIEEIRTSLLGFRESGKWVVAYSEVMSEGAYYLASAADKIYLYPEGEIELNGLSLEVTFFKRLFDKLEIKPEIFRVGEYKSAVEPFLLEKMSPENRLQLTELAHSINNTMLQRIAEARKIPVEKLKEISDKMLVRNAAQAKEFGLVDELWYQDQFTANLRERLNIAEDAEVSLVKYSKYRKSYSDYKSSKNEIAVIVADGTIVPGKSDAQRTVAGETYAEAIRKARMDNDVKAIVLRINSPGGEFRASDMMWREVDLATKAKPVIASMGDYAASGGYYMAMACDTIVAQPNTITGSIGIFGMMFDASGFLNNKIGITFDEVKTGEFGELVTISRPLTEVEKSYWQKSLDAHYETFTSKAAAGRGVSVEDIKKVASGRVWTGQQAIDKKLVDVLGGFNDAVKIAANAAGVAEDYKIKYYPQQPAFFEQLVASLEENAKADAIKAELGDSYIWYQQVKQLNTFQGAQARMPFEIELH